MLTQKSRQLDTATVSTGELAAIRTRRHSARPTMMIWITFAGDASMPLYSAIMCASVP